MGTTPSELASGIEEPQVRHMVCKQRFCFLGIGSVEVKYRTPLSDFWWYSYRWTVFLEDQRISELGLADASNIQKKNE